MKSHPDFRLEGRSQHFQSFWELELTPGESTIEHQHYESEELIYFLNAEGKVRIAELERSVAPGEVVLVPPRTDHVISNQSEGVIRAITVESRLDLGTKAPEIEAGEAAGEAVIRAEEKVKLSARSVDELMGNLPRQVDEAHAIKAILELFDIGGNLSEEIETSLGLTNASGLEALSELEKKIMHAVVEISARYQQRGGRWLLG